MTGRCVHHSSPVYIWNISGLYSSTFCENHVGENLTFESIWLKSLNGHALTIRAIIDVNSIVSGQNYDI